MKKPSTQAGRIYDDFQVYGIGHISVDELPEDEDMAHWENEGMMIEATATTIEVQTGMTEYCHILKVLGVIFVEIRGTENLKKARILADIFHNVPALIKVGKTQDEIIAHIMEKAERQNASEIITKYLEAAE